MMSEASDWIEWRDWAADGLRPMDDLCCIMVRNRYDEEFGPILAGMIGIDAFHGSERHASCDIIAYRVVTP